MKLISIFNHGFTNRGCLYCVIPKALHSFKEKRNHKAREMHFSFEMFQMRFSRF